MSITFVWSKPIDNGGCPITEYRVYRDTGNGDNVVNEIQTADLAGKNYVNGLIVTDLPAGSLGKSFVFKVKVFSIVAT